MLPQTSACYIYTRCTLDIVSSLVSRYHLLKGSKNGLSADDAQHRIPFLREGAIDHVVVRILFVLLRSLCSHPTCLQPLIHRELCGQLHRVYRREP